MNETLCSMLSLRFHSLLIRVYEKATTPPAFQRRKEGLREVKAVARVTWLGGGKARI